MDGHADWNAYRSFLGVLRLGSLSAAARALKLTQPTIGRHIAALETELGAALFIRSVRGLVPTESALAIRSHAENIEAAVEASRRVTSAPAAAPAGVVRITASQVVGGEVLPEMLRNLRRKHDGLVFELSLSNETEDLTRRDADIAVRMVRPTQGSLVAVPAGRIMLGLFGRRDYLARHGTPKSLDDLARHTIIGFDRETPFLSFAKRRLRLERSMFALRTDSDLAQVNAIRAGFGLGLCQVPIGRRSGLVHLLANEMGYALDVWITMHEDLKPVRRMRVVFDHLADAMRAYAKTG